MDAGLFVLRMLGVVYALHGFQKLFGWFGGGGLDGTASWFDSIGFRPGRRAAIMAGASEVLGGLGIAVGLLVPIAAAAVLGTMTVAAKVNHEDNGFWSAKKGWEYNLALMLWAAGLAMTGPGAWSLGHLLSFEIASPAVGAAAIVVGIGGGLAQLAARQDV